MILTAGHCIPQRVFFKINGTEYNTSVETNSYYPTMISMFKVYLGFQNLTELNTTAVEMSVRKVIVVS